MEKHTQWRQDGITLFIGHLTRVRCKYKCQNKMKLPGGRTEHP